MNDEQIVAYTKRMIMCNLKQYELYRDIGELECDETNKVLLAHIDGIIELLEKAKEIILKEKAINNGSE